MRAFFIIVLVFLTACTPKMPPADEEPRLLSFYVTPSAEEWVPLIYNCADRTQSGLVLRTPNIAEAEISLRLNVPPNVDSPAYQIGDVELVVVANAANPVSELSRAEVEAIFEGKIRNWAELGGDDAEIRLWVYGQNDDLQVVFNEMVLGVGSLSTLARQAQSPHEMREAIAGDTNAIGIISHAQAGTNLRIIHSLGGVPVLVIPTEEAQGNIFSFLSCLQRK